MRIIKPQPIFEFVIGRKQCRLSFQRYPVDEIAQICRVHRTPICNWIDIWNAHQRLEDKERSGRLPTLNLAEQAKAIEMRIIEFEVCQSKFRLLTNRRDLTTLEIIILSAYRWQIELFFKYVKRTLKGLHLFNHSQNGVEIQFYLLMTLAILMLKFKQAGQKVKTKKREKSEKKSEEREISVRMDQKNHQNLL